MKVGTDGVLIGAWAASSAIPAPARILDVGTGTGVISLMMAQRYPQAMIDAVETDPSAAQQAAENFRHSPWASRLHLWQGDFTVMYGQLPGPYDLIVSNPPYFSKGWPVDHDGRKKARVAEQLPAAIWIRDAKQLIHPQGVLAVVLPARESVHFSETASSLGWYLSRRTQVYTTPGKPVKRVLLEWRTYAQALSENDLVIQDTAGNYTEDYKALTRDFYLAF